MLQRSGGYLQIFKLIHAKLKKERIAHVQLRQDMIYTVAHLVIQIQAMIKRPTNPPHFTGDSRILKISPAFCIGTRISRIR